MKGVVWSDTIQMMIIIIGLIVLCALGAQKAGGGTFIYNDNFAAGRLNFNK
jgi:Na+/proline symporter